jgi:hypothetical protein
MLEDVIRIDAIKKTEKGWGFSITLDTGEKIAIDGESQEEIERFFDVIVELVIG